MSIDKLPPVKLGSRVILTFGCPSVPSMLSKIPLSSLDFFLMQVFLEEPAQQLITVRRRRRADLSFSEPTRAMGVVILLFLTYIVDKRVDDSVISLSATSSQANLVRPQPVGGWLSTVKDLFNFRKFKYIFAESMILHWIP